MFTNLETEGEVTLTCYGDVPSILRQHGNDVPASTDTARKKIKEFVVDTIEKAIVSDSPMSLRSGGSLGPMSNLSGNSLNRVSSGRTSPPAS